MEMILSSICSGLMNLEAMFLQIPFSVFLRFFLKSLMIDKLKDHPLFDLKRPSNPLIFNKWIARTSSSLFAR